MICEAREGTTEVTAARLSRRTAEECEISASIANKTSERTGSGSVLGVVFAWQSAPNSLVEKLENLLLHQSGVGDEDRKLP